MGTNLPWLFPGNTNRLLTIIKINLKLRLKKCFKNHNVPKLRINFYLIVLYVPKHISIQKHIAQSFFLMALLFGMKKEPTNPVQRPVCWNFFKEHFFI